MRPYFSDLPSPSDSPRFADLRRLQDSGDRTATRAVLRRFVHASEPGLIHELALTLCRLEDPRAVPTLERILLDREASNDRRLASLRVLDHLAGDEPERERALAWTADRDPVVRAYGVSFLDPQDERELAAAVRDPSVVVRRAATENLIGLARTPLLVDALRGALADTDPCVRLAACHGALFDEPLRLVRDVARCLEDTVEDVRWAAADALEDLPSVAAALALADARGTGVDPGGVRMSLELLLRRILEVVDDPAAPGGRRVRRWSAPLGWLLAEVRAASAAAPVPDRADDGADDREGGFAPVELDHASGLVTNADAPYRAQVDALYARDWSSSGERGLAVLREAASSRAWRVRRGAAAALLTLARRDRRAVSTLVELAHDSDASVVECALEALGMLGEQAVVEPALRALGPLRVRLVAGDAALAALRDVAPDDVVESAVQRIFDRGDDVDGLRLGAVHVAARRRITSLGSLLARIVEAPVVASVGAHVAALRLLRTHHPELRPDLAHLDDVDHLDVQQELGARATAVQVGVTPRERGRPRVPTSPPSAVSSAAPLRRPS